MGIEWAIGWEEVVKLLLTIVVGGAIGAEREFRDKSAGFRTLIFICLGAALFTMVSLEVALRGGGDPGRIAAGVVTGVGFLGAGAIFRGARTVSGLTTASTIWLVAALGMGIGAGYLLLSSVATAAILVILWVFPALEDWIDNVRHTRSYEVTLDPDPQALNDLDRLFQQPGLSLRGHKRVKSKDTLICTWMVTGAPERHEQLVEQLLAHPKIREFQF